MNTRTIKRRIKSVMNTRKITKAMELVAASKMRKAVNAVVSSRDFAILAWDTVSAIGKTTNTSSHPLLKKRDKDERILIVLLTSDRGLAGPFNTNILRKVTKTIHELENDSKIDFITIGKKGADAMRRMNQNVIASFTDITNNPSFQEVLPIGKMIIDEFSKETYDKVILAYTDFVSTISQDAKILDLLPLGSQESLRSIGELKEQGKEIEVHSAEEYTFEPNAMTVLNQLLPRLIETTLYQAVLESAASEHSSRMMAMRSASDSASDMLDALTLSFNQARQASITQEIAEISSGKAALEN